MRIALTLILAIFVHNSIADAPATGSLAPAWTLQTAEGVDLAFNPEQRDRPSLLLFWATWCPYCRALMPHLEDLRKSLADTQSSIDVLALNIWEDGKPLAYLRKHGLAFTLLPEAESVAERYGVKGTPGLFLVDATGAILYQRSSGTSPEDVVKAISRALEAAAAFSDGSIAESQ